MDNNPSNGTNTDDNGSGVTLPEVPSSAPVNSLEDFEEHARRATDEQFSPEAPRQQTFDSAKYAISAMDRVPDADRGAASNANPETKIAEPTQPRQPQGKQPLSYKPSKNSTGKGKMIIRYILIAAMIVLGVALLWVTGSIIFNSGPKLTEYSESENYRISYPELWEVTPSETSDQVQFTPQPATDVSGDGEVDRRDIEALFLVSPNQRVIDLSVDENREIFKDELTKTFTEPSEDAVEEELLSIDGRDYYKFTFKGVLNGKDVIARIWQPAIEQDDSYSLISYTFQQSDDQYADKIQAAVKTFRNL